MSTRMVVAAMALAVAVLSSCTMREVKRETVVVDGQPFLCSKVVNRISGNEASPQCAPIDGNEP